MNVSITGVSDFFLAIPVPVGFYGEQAHMTSSCINLSNNHKFKNLIVGYGISFARNRWNLVYYDRFDPPPPTREPVEKIHYALGLNLPIRYEFNNIFGIGVTYRPTFYRPNIPNKFAYEHLISFEFIFKRKIRD